MEEILNTITWHHLAFLFALTFTLVFRQPNFPVYFENNKN